MWSHLRNRQLDGWKFRRQFPIAGFVVDFYCPEARLAIELDGPVHLEAEVVQRDLQRKQLLDAANVRTVRFTNDDVLTNTSGVLDRIRSVLSPSPFANGEGARG